MDKYEFIRAGERLYGKWGWKAQLAKNLKRHPNTITKYASGKTPVPKAVELAMLHLEAER